MANTLKLDHENGRIVMDRVFAKKSENTMSNEYAHLQNVRRDYPTYTVVRHTIKKNTSKETYKGLTYKYMEAYIKKHNSELMKDYNRNRGLNKDLADNLANPYSYAQMREWFLDNFNELRIKKNELEA